MKGSELLLLMVLASSLCLSTVIAAQQTCPAYLDSKCDGAVSDDWEGEFFPGVPKIKYEGPTSKNPLAYKWYNKEEVILGKKMKDWMRFSVAFWHTFRGTGADPFGAPTKAWPWEDGTNSLAMAKRRIRAHFEFMEKLGVDKWCFHDRDIAPDGKTLEIHHELRPILSSSSSSAARSSQLRMAPGHNWDNAEEVAVFDEARTIIAGNPQYPSKAWLHRQISDRLNGRFSGPFNGPMVKAKLSLFRERWRSQGHIAPGDRVLYTTRNRIRITDHEATFEALFAETDGESTNSGAVSLESGPVNGSGPVSFSCSSSKKKEVSPEVQAAVDFMAAGNGEQRSTGRELLIFTTMLNNVPYLLSNFNALPNDYEVRRISLIDVFKLGGQGVPNIPQDKLPQDFL